MADTAEESRRLALATASRLRLVQVDFADESPEVREQYLDDEIRRAMAELPAGQQQAFLRYLMNSFPSWSSQSAGGPPRRQEPAAAPEPVQRGPDDLVEQLVEQAASLSDEERARLAEKLRAAGLAPAGGAEPSVPQESQQRMSAVLSVARGRISPVRVFDLAALLVDFANQVDQLAWNTWRRLAPRSRVRAAASLRDGMGEFVQSDQQAAAENLRRQLMSLRRLVAALIAAVGQVGLQFSEQHYARFSPLAIEAAVRAEGGSLLVGHEVKCWRKYVQLAEALDVTAVEAEIKATVVSAAESLLAGVGE